MDVIASADMLCIGGGLAGLTCAARAAELGLRVVVAESGEQSDYPCNSRYSAGVFHASYLDVALPGDELISAMRRATIGESHDDLLQVIAEDANRTLEWYRARGGKFVRGPQKSWVMAPPRGMSTGLDWKGRGPDALLRALTRHIVDRQGRILLGTRVDSLVRDGERIVGVTGLQNGRRIRIDAPSVVIADGGFSANPRMIGDHIGKRPDLVFQRNAGTAVGDGLKIAIEAGAAHSSLNRFYGHLLSRDVFSKPNLWPFPQIDAVAAQAIVVDPEGRRLFDEGLGGIFLSNEIAALDDPLSTTVIFDQKAWDAGGREHQVPPNPLLEKHGGTLHRAGTIEELARIAGLQPETLVKTVKAYNEAVEANDLGRLSPARSAPKARAQTISQAPFMAIPVCAGITHTMGGVIIDRHARALDAHDQPIPGLYAAGAAVGGVEGGSNAGYVGGLIKAVFGLRAAEYIAETRKVPASA